MISSFGPAEEEPSGQGGGAGDAGPGGGAGDAGPGGGAGDAGPGGGAGDAGPDDGAGATGFGDLRAGIDAALAGACQWNEGCPETLAEAIRYAVLAPGKRLRPGMVLMAAEACGGSHRAAMPAAVAVEMIHAYSLIHDDLPAMDDDDLRRGRPTVHIRFGETTAILAGDALQAEAFGQLAGGLQDKAVAAEAVGVLARAAGAAALVGGQADDLAAEFQQGATVDQLASIHRRKTGALIAASVDLGALVSGADTEARQRLADYAGDLGLAFQVVDDLLDWTADDTKTGKRTGKDAGRGKLTYPGLLGIPAARQKAERLIQSAHRHASSFGSAGWRLQRLADYVLERPH